ncbi:MAG: hypothetical protein UY39_C0051G0002 [Candidatus Kaiserbacteria bacterium GW2011_GWC2_49_12]|uniref:Uncharacterized protein n=1 Tax=Candidatus Kaiserbacteria bacterium GW2011_GWC2_49_12 TaxID=1618675 RepID=A0A0G1VHL6_9BACT|nr:MAG: hypothetical protein UY39_C0051G0002 [Candidatus Kaiserbacteria bacterium GW2011_GWC2_49_12]
MLYELKVIAVVFLMGVNSPPITILEPEPAFELFRSFERLMRIEVQKAANMLGEPDLRIRIFGGCIERPVGYP